MTNRFVRFTPFATAAAALFLFTTAAAAAPAVGVDAAEMETGQRIHAHNVATPKAAEADPSQPYSAAIPGTEVQYTMVPIPAGAFTMGSPPDEKGRADDEGPQRRVTVSAFWMGSTEVTWDAFELFMYPDRDSASDQQVDAVSRPTPPYVDMSFGMGKEGYPAISMTHHAASKYCQWLSAKTGHFYRLPTEAEWEYAARAGTDTPWSFGADEAAIDDFAWHSGNSGRKSQPVGQKKPNRWGLHDMHGSVWEWTLDQYDPDGYKTLLDQIVDPWAKPTAEYPRVVRGGSWNDDPTKLRSAARRGSDRDWKMMDPQFPQSIWYHTNALWLGFRIVRPVEIPSPEAMYEYWNR